MEYFLMMEFSKNLENLLGEEEEGFGGWWAIGEVELPEVHGDILHDHVDFVFYFVVGVVLNHIWMIEFLDDVELSFFPLGCFTPINFLDGCYHSGFDVYGFPYLSSLQEMASFPIFKTLLNVTKIFLNDSLFLKLEGSGYALGDAE